MLTARWPRTKPRARFVLAGLGGVAVSALVSLLAYVLVFRRLMGRSVMALLLASIGVGFTIRAIHGFVFGQGQYVFQVPLSRPYIVLACASARSISR